MQTMHDIIARLTGLLDGREGFKAAVLFDCGEDGAVLIDGRGGRIKVTPGPGEADCIIAMPSITFARIMRGELDETSAFMQGDMRLTGTIGLASQISDLIRARAQADATAS